MTAFHLPVLIRPTWLDVAQADPSFLDRQGKDEREFDSIVALHFADRKREGLPEGGQALETGVVVFA